MEYVKLNNGVEIPLLGMGTMGRWDSSDFANCEQAVLCAIEEGYRLFDSAATYQTMEAIGKAVKKSGIDRKELFITSKLWVQDFSYEKAKDAFQTELCNAGLEYLDMLLLHQACSDYYGAWRALEDLYEAGKIRAIGVCNFFPGQLADLCVNARIKPMVNQVECHPFRQQNDAIQTMDKFGVVCESWGSLNQAKDNIFANEVLTEIGEQYGKTVAQVMLRWNIQRGVVVIPKSYHKERLAENINVFDFKLSKEDMDKIAQLDGGVKEDGASLTADTIVFLNQYRIGNALA